MIRYAYHTTFNVEDALQNWSELFWEHHARMRDTTPDAERHRFIAAREAGIKYLPATDECDNHDEELGCRGHLAGDH